MGLFDKQIGFERNSYFFPAYMQDRMTVAFGDKELYDCYGIVEDGRVCKSPCEIDLMHRAAKATEAGMQAGYDACVVGATENDIAAEISAAMFKAGGEFGRDAVCVIRPAQHDRSCNMGRPRSAGRRTCLS